MADRLSRSFTTSVTWLERLLSLAMLVGIMVYGISSGLVLAGMDWRSEESFYELIYRVLLMVIGLELVRMLLTHDLSVVLELLAFVTARTVLKLDTKTLDIVLAVLAFVALLAARWYFLAAREGAAQEKQAQADDSPRSGQV